MKKNIPFNNLTVKKEEVKKPLFDDALPEQLVSVMPEKKDKTLRLRIDEPVSPSPFVVRLTRADEVGKPAHDPIAELAKSLVYDADEEEAEAALVEAEIDSETMRIALRQQVREGDGSMEEGTRRAISHGSPLNLRQSEDELLLAPELPVELTDIFAALIADGNDEEGPVLTSENVAIDVETEKIPIVHAVVIEEVFEESTPAQTVQSAQIHVIRFGWSRALASFVALAVLLVLPLQALQVFASARGTEDEVTGESKVALDAFLRGATSLSEKRFTTAGEDFSRAAEEFKNVEQSLDDMHAAVVAVVNVLPQTDRTMTSVRGLVTAGQELSQTAELLALAGEDIAPQKSIDLVTKIELLGAYIEEAKPHVDAARDALAKVDPAVIPEEYQGKVSELKEKVPQIASAFGEYLLFTDALTLVLGGEQKMKYLAAFQNNTEL